MSTKRGEGHRISAYDIDTRNRRWKNQQYDGGDEFNEVIPLRLTKLEVQNSKKHKSFPAGLRLDSLATLEEVDPFQHLNFMNIYRQYEFSSAERLRAFNELKVLAVAHGYHNARFIMNKLMQRNIGRLEKEMRPVMVGNTGVSLKDLMTESFRQGFTAWMNA